VERGKLVIIDDDRSTRDALQGLFISRGWEVAMAATQAEAHHLLDDYRPDWVIVAWEQLGGAGWPFLRELRSDRPDVRVAILTEAGGRIARAWVRRLAPDAVYAKPVIPEMVYRDCDTVCPSTNRMAVV
jgi:DNA-binding response OmpR family regulator